MPINVTSCKVAFLKSKIPEGCVNPICIIDDPGFATLIAFCLVSSRPTVSNIISSPECFLSSPIISKFHHGSLGVDVKCP